MHNSSTLQSAAEYLVRGHSSKSRAPPHQENKVCHKTDNDKAFIGHRPLLRRSNKDPNLYSKYPWVHQPKAAYNLPSFKSCMK